MATYNGQYLYHYFVHVWWRRRACNIPNLIRSIIVKFSVVNHYLEANSIYITNELVLPVVQTLLRRMQHLKQCRIYEHAAEPLYLNRDGLYNNNVKHNSTHKCDE